MSQVSWRATPELVERVRSAAVHAGFSMNEYVSQVLDAATNPELEGDLAVRTRERLERAGLVLQPWSPRVRPDAGEVAAARHAAASGPEGAELIADGRGPR